MKNFRKELKELMEPHGFMFIWAENHPNEFKDSVHYIRYGVRACFTLDKDKIYFCAKAEFWMFRKKNHYSISSPMGAHSAIYWLTEPGTIEFIMKHMNTVLDDKYMIEVSYWKRVWNRIRFRKKKSFEPFKT